MIRAACLLWLACAVFALAPRLAIADGEIDVERDVEYSNPKDQHLKLDLARPKQSDHILPAVVFIHGGGWAGGNRAGWFGTCEELARRGFVAMTVQYRFAPAFPFPAAVEDVQASLRWLKANSERLKVDTSRIGVAGDSAGGHLAQCLGVGADVDRLAPSPTADRCRVACVVNIYGPSDFTRHYKFNGHVDQLLTNFLGGGLEEARHNYILASPYFWVTPDAAPTLIIHGDKDEVVPYAQATALRDRMQAADVEVELLTLEGAGHGFKGADAEKSHAALIAWFESHLKGDQK